MEHKQLASSRWIKFALNEQMANIGSEIERTILWKNKNNRDYSMRALYRALELLDMTIGDPKNKPRTKELTRLREALVDYFLFDNKFSSSYRLWRNYFNPFVFYSRINR